jgi:LysM repeat protein
MREELTRRGLLIGGAVLLVTGCTRQAQDTADTYTPVTALPATTPPPAPASGGITYTVVKGDTLAAIARRSGTTVEAITAANNLSSPRLAIGQSLYLPGATAVGPDPLAGQITTTEVAPREARAGDNGGGYTLVRRSAWTKEPVDDNIRPMNGVSRITIHHTGEHPGMEGLPETEVLRRIERYHRDEKGWAAIGYHYIVGKTGTVYEGRPCIYQGAHVLTANEHNLGISVIGDFQNVRPNPAQLAAVDDFLTDQRERFSVPMSRIYGHRELHESICPGNALFAWVKDYRS